MRHIALPALVAALLFGLALPAWALSFTGEGRSLYEGDDQYIRLVPQDLGRVASPPHNDHPVQLPAEDIELALRQIAVRRSAGLFANAGEPIPLFTAAEAKLLGLHLADGLYRARPTEDIVFAVSGLYEGTLLGLGKERRSTAGRVFFLEGRLHLIVGDLLRGIVRGREVDVGMTSNRVDRRLFPHQPGERAEALKQEGRILLGPGMEYVTPGDTQREDWLALDLPQVVAAARHKAVPKEVAEETARVHEESAQVREEAAKAGLERRQMLLEMARMRKKMQDMEQGGGGAGSGGAGAGGANPGVAGAAAAGASAGAGGAGAGAGGAGAEGVAGTAEARLRRLDDLKAKGLVSPAEYAERRRAILNEL
jgi:hypothetical protein